MFQLAQADGRNPTASTNTYEKRPLLTISLPSPSVPQRSKSITDFHKRARRRAKEQDDHDGGGDRGLVDLSLASDLDFARSYDQASDALADATHEKYQ